MKTLESSLQHHGGKPVGRWGNSVVSAAERLMKGLDDKIKPSMLAPACGSPQNGALRFGPASRP
jgi:hypothetical protein